MLRWLAAAQPAVVGLNETKGEDGIFPLAAIEAAGYTPAIRGQIKYTGLEHLISIPSHRHSLWYTAQLLGDL